MGGKGFLEKGFRNGQLVIPSAESWLLGEEDKDTWVLSDFFRGGVHT